MDFSLWENDMELYRYINIIMGFVCLWCNSVLNFSLWENDVELYKYYKYINIIMVFVCLWRSSVEVKWTCMNNSKKIVNLYVIICIIIFNYLISNLI